LKIISIVGARPNFMKVAPLAKAFDEYNSNTGTLEHIIVHTGQHYDNRMSESFFEQLNIPKAKYNLGVGSGTHAEQVGKTMIELEKVLVSEKPDWVIVIGDVNATLAGSVTAKKLGIKVCHLESGLRSRDMRMPEEINRLVTDRLSDLLLTPDKISIANLKSEGVADENIAFVGNIMIDTLVKHRPKAQQIETQDILLNNQMVDQTLPEIEKKDYIVVTVHRPSNVDNEHNLSALVGFFLSEVVKDTILIWPIHPRTLKKLHEFDLYERFVSEPNVILLHPLSYHEMLSLNMKARMILTDSGGLQEEACVLGVPCLTLRTSTERPITLRSNGGASVLVGEDIEKLRLEYNAHRNATTQSSIPELWDGNTSNRCLEAILQFKA
jgi:UDP-N-acetylglucosamine 2-epimerase (non-hydrolysing)